MRKEKIDLGKEKKKNESLQRIQQEIRLPSPNFTVRWIKQMALKTLLSNSASPLTSGVTLSLQVILADLALLFCDTGHFMHSVYVKQLL